MWAEKAWGWAPFLMIGVEVALVISGVLSPSTAAVLLTVLDLAVVLLFAVRAVRLYRATRGRRVTGVSGWEAFEQAAAEQLTAPERLLLSEVRRGRRVWLAVHRRGGEPRAGAPPSAPLRIRRLPVRRRWLGRRVPRPDWPQPREITWGSEWRPLAITIAVLSVCSDLPGSVLIIHVAGLPYWVGVIAALGDVWFAVWCWQWVQYSRRNPHQVAADGIQIMMGGSRWLTVPAAAIDEVTARKGPARRRVGVSGDELELSRTGEANLRINLVSGVCLEQDGTEIPLTALTLRADSPAELIDAWRHADSGSGSGVAIDGAQ